VYTQCSKCETVFRLSAEVLRVAGGQVRCGRCGELFNALARLAEEPGAFAVGETALELEARADDILRTAPRSPVPDLEEAPDTDFSSPPDDDAVEAPGVEIARLQVLDWRDLDLPDPASSEDDAPPRPAVPGDRSASMEYTLPPGELDRIFIEDKRQAQKARAGRSTPAHADEAAGPPDSGVDVDIDLGVGDRDDSDSPGDGGFSDSRGDIRGDLRSDLRDDLRNYLRQGTDGGAQQVGAQRGTELDGSDGSDGIDGIDGTESSARRRAYALWIGAAILGVLALGAQWVHQNREWLAAREPFGAAVRTLYAGLGNALPAPANLSAYQLRQWGVTGDPGANGKLRVRASILNTAGLFQPYPLLRVTLANRFGNRIGARDFEPAEYLGKPTARLLAPGERADATIDIVDPGNDAEGFEIDVCTRGADQRIACANDLSAHAH
jgi:predicted Zn finger-like uncharacterized protein